MNFKEQLLDEVTSKVKQKEGFLLMCYKDLCANDFAILREELFALNSGVFVFKKRLFKKSFESLKIGFDLSDVKNSIGVISIGELLPAAKLVNTFGKNKEDKITILGGFFEGIVYSREDIVEICNLPDKDTMRSNLLSVLQAPMSNVVALFNELMLSVVHCIDNKKGKNE